MGKKPSKLHSLDRFPNQKGNYQLTNCRWATPTEQARNIKSNVILTINGKSKCIAEWASDTNMPLKRIYDRIDRGWNHFDAVFAPIQRIKRKGLINY